MQMEPRGISSCTKASGRAAAPTEVTAPALGLGRIEQIRTLSQLLQECRWNDPDRVKTAFKLELLCQKLGPPLETLLLEPTERYDSALEELLRHGDRDILRLVHRNVSNGWLIKDKIERTVDGLRLFDGNPSVSWGFQRVGRCVYVGPFLNEDRHGANGILHYAKDWYYKGDFRHNQRHGFGEDYSEGIDGRRQVGLFIDDIYRGNPHSQAIDKPKKWLSCFRRK